MERIIIHTENANEYNALSYEKAAAQFMAEKEENQEVSCTLLLTNLLRNNLMLLKFNEISTILLL